MKMTLIVSALALASITGCSREQKVEASDAAKRAETQVKQTAAKAQHNLSDGAITIKVKSALSLSDRLDTSGINVDTGNRIVHLRGIVPTSEQKALAERIARDMLRDDIRIVSELIVRQQVAPKEVR